MSNDKLTQLHDVLAFSLEKLKKCQSAYKGFRAFKDNPQGLAFCAEQLQQEASTLRDYTQQLAAIAEDLQTTYGLLAQPEEMPAIHVDGHLGDD